MTLPEGGRMENIYRYHIRNIPHMVEEESDTDRYLRAFASLVSSFGDEVDVDDVIGAMKDAVRFIADDSFARGFETCHENMVVPLRETTIGREVALAEMRRHGELVRQAIVAKFEEAPGVPNQITVDIDEVELPEPNIRVAR